MDEDLERSDDSHHNLAGRGQVRGAVVDRDIPVRVRRGAGGGDVLLRVDGEEEERSGDERADEEEDGHDGVRLDESPVPRDRADESVRACQSIWAGGRRGGRERGGVPEERRERGERRNCADDDEDNLCPLGHICVAVLLRQDHCSLHVSTLCSRLEHELRTVHGIPHNGREEARGEEGEEREEEDTRADGDAAAEVP